MWCRLLVPGKLRSRCRRGKGACSGASVAATVHGGVKRGNPSIPREPRAAALVACFLIARTGWATPVVRACSASLVWLTIMLCIDAQTVVGERPKNCQRNRLLPRVCRARYVRVCPAVEAEPFWFWRISSRTACLRHVRFFGRPLGKESFDG